MGSGLLAWTCKKFCHASLQNRGGRTEPTPKGSQEGENLIVRPAFQNAIGEGRANAAPARLMTVGVHERIAKKPNNSIIGWVRSGVRLPEIRTSG